MARKNSLDPIYVNLTAAGPTPSTLSLSASFNTVSTAVPYQDGLNYQINISTSNSIGNFYLQASDDNVNFADVGQAAIVASASDVAICEITQVTAKYYRLRYQSATAGTGTCQIFLTARSIGA